MGSRRDRRKRARKREASVTTQKQVHTETLPSDDRSPRVAKEPSGEKQARTGEHPLAYQTERPAWRIRLIDRGGSWPITDDILISDIRPKLHHFESMTWNEIEAATTGGSRNRRKAHHEMPVYGLDAKAQKRLTDNKLDTDTLFRFKLGNKVRLWGIREQQIFNLLWYDPNHTVYPTEP